MTKLQSVFSARRGIGRAATRLLLLAGLAAVAAGPVTGQWRSQLYPSNWTPGFKDAQGRFLHDFSYAGYHRGAKPIPTTIPGVRIDVTQAPYNADASGSADATQAIQRAIDAVGSSGGGVVYLPAGTYRLRYANSRISDSALWVHDDGVVLRGAGAGRTKLFLDETVTRRKNLVRFRSRDGGTWHSSRGGSTTLRSDLPNQSMVVPVPNASSYSVGDWIVIRTDATPAWIAEHGMTGLWTSGLVGLTIYREILEVSTSRGTITLDTPTRYPMKTRDNLRIYRVADPLEEAGLEDLSIGMRQNTKSGFGDSDYTRSGTGAYEVHASDAVLFYHARNCWIQRVHTYRPSVNTSDVHCHSDAFALNYSRLVTVKDCVADRPQYLGGGGNGYGFVLQGADCLFVGNSSDRTRHSFSFKNLRTTGNVLLRNTSTNARYPLDFHMHLSMSNLVDNTTLDRDFIAASYRTSGTIVHGYSTSQSVIWNTNGIRYGSRSYIVDSRQYGYGYVIGTRGNANAVITTPTTVSGKQTAPVDWLEGVGRGSTLQPASLYEDQLVRRLRTVASYVGIGTGCGGASLVPLATTRPLLGTTFQTLAFKPTGASLGVGVLGFQRTSAVDLTSIGMTNCSLYFRWDILAPLSPFSAQTDRWLLPIPSNRQLLGARFYQQALSLSPASNPFGIILTNAGEGVIGDF